MNRRIDILYRAGIAVAFVAGLSACNSPPTPRSNHAEVTAITPATDSPKLRLVSPGEEATPIPPRNGFQALKELGFSTKDINNKLQSEYTAFNDQRVLVYTNISPSTISSVNEGVKIPDGYFLCIMGNYTAMGLGGTSPLEPDHQVEAKVKKGGVSTDKTKISCFSSDQNIYGLQINSNTSLTFLSPGDMRDLFPDR